jgi:Sulfotransferase family
MAEAPAPFIVGVSRSGTTLLRLMLDAHPDLTIPFETHFVHKLAALDEAEVARDRFYEIATTSASWPNLQIDADALRRALDDMPEFTVTGGLRAFYRLFTARAGKGRWGDKTPHYLLSMTGIQRLLPEAHFIHIIRDGRDTALSFRGLWFGLEDLEAAARHWSDGVRAARRQAPDLRHYLEVRYEALVLDTEASLRRICAWLGLTFDPAMLDYHRTSPERLNDIVHPFGLNGGDRLDIETFRSIHANTTRPPDPDLIGRWRSALTDEEQQRFEAIAGDLLAELGYETRYRPRANPQGA